MGLLAAELEIGAVAEVEIAPTPLKAVIGVVVPVIAKVDVVAVEVAVHPEADVEETVDEADVVDGAATRLRAEHHHLQQLQPLQQPPILEHGLPLPSQKSSF